MKLFPYQRAGVLFLELRNGRALIADEMGLGKTVQVCGWLKHRRSVRPVIIVCPTSVRLHWQNLISLILNEQSYLPVSQRSSDENFNNQSFIIIHYSILSYWVDWLKRLKAKVLVIDEAQGIKSIKARRSKAVEELSKNIPHVIGLTGTPIVNRPIEAFNILRIIDKNAIPGFHKYTRRYCKAKRGRFGWDYSGASNTRELHKILTESKNPIMLRRRKKDVLPSLPTKIRSFVPLELDNRNEYDESERDFIGYLTKTEGKAVANKAKKALALTRISKLRLLAARGKLDQAIDWIADIIQEQKLVVFAIHREILDPVFDRFRKVAVRIDGSINGIDRGRAIDRFQNDVKCRLFIGQVQAAGTGITLTAASNVAFLELPWTPGDLLQCEDRCHRIGQMSSVSIYYLLAAQTIDEDMARLIDRKRTILDSVLDGAPDDAPDASLSILVELLELYKQRGMLWQSTRQLQPS